MRMLLWAKPAAVPHRCRLDHAASGLRQARAHAQATNRPAATARRRSIRRGPAHDRRPPHRAGPRHHDRGPRGRRGRAYPGSQQITQFLDEKTVGTLAIMSDPADTCYRLIRRRPIPIRSRRWAGPRVAPAAATRRRPGARRCTPPGSATTTSGPLRWRRGLARPARGPVPARHRRRPARAGRRGRRRARRRPAARQLTTTSSWPSRPQNRDDRFQAPATDRTDLAQHPGRRGVGLEPRRLIHRQRHQLAGVVRAAAQAVLEVTAAARARQPAAAGAASSSWLRRRRGVVLAVDHVLVDRPAGRTDPLAAADGDRAGQGRRRRAVAGPWPRRWPRRSRPRPGPGWGGCAGPRARPAAASHRGPRPPRRPGRRAAAGRRRRLGRPCRSRWARRSRADCGLPGPPAEQHPEQEAGADGEDHHRHQHQQLGHAAGRQSQDLASMPWRRSSLCRYLRSMSASRAALEMLPSARLSSQVR